MIVVDDSTKNMLPEAQANFKKHKVVTVTKDWVLDSLCGFSVRPINEYLKHVTSDEELAQAGYIV